MSDLSVKTDMAEKIKNRRNEIRLRQQELADKIGVSVITISRWENPKSGRTPNASMLPKLAEALNTSVEYLMGLGDSEEKPPQPQESQLKQLLDSLSSLAASAPPKNSDNNVEGSNGNANGNNAKVKIKDPLFGNYWEYDPNKQPPELGITYWGNVLDNMRRLARSNPDPSDLTLILSMLESGIEELKGAKGSKNQSHGVVMNNYNGDNTVGTINMKGE